MKDKTIIHPSNPATHIEQKNPNCDEGVKSDGFLEFVQ